MTLSRVDAPFPHWQVTAADGDQLQVVPERGGLITGWRCGGEECLYFDAERFADPSKSVRGGIPVLFPVCGTLAGDEFALPQHGFARDQPWQLEELQGAPGIRLTLTDSPVTRAVYPFGFRLTLDYSLEPGALAIRALVECTDPSGETAMPFALGLHPYLKVVSLAAARLEGLPERCFDHLSHTEAATADQLARLEQGVDLRVDGSHGEAPQPWLLTGRNTAVELQMQAPLAHAVVWSDPPRPMVCLEPWSARRGEWGRKLLPGEHCELRCRYVIRPV